MTDQLAMFAAVLAAAGIFLSAFLYARIQSESAGRRDQSCAIAERAHLEDVKALERTYDYLVRLSPAQRLEPINQAVFANLRVNEQAARVDRAADFCDEPGIGLPEPDPVIPSRPKNLNP